MVVSVAVVSTADGSALVTSVVIGSVVVDFVAVDSDVVGSADEGLVSEGGCGDSLARFLPKLPIRRIKVFPSFFFLSTLGELSVLRDASLAASRFFLFRLRIVRSSRPISPSEATDLEEPVRLIKPMWKGEPGRNGVRSVCRVRRRREGAGRAGDGEAGGRGGSSSRMVVHGARRYDCREPSVQPAAGGSALFPDIYLLRITKFRLATTT